jgi:hypothetical protein
VAGGETGQSWTTPDTRGSKDTTGLNDYEPDEFGHGLRTADYIRKGRDYHIGEAKPGYAKYVYPHPLRKEPLRYTDFSPPGR